MSVSTYCLKLSKREELRERIYSNHLAYLAQEDSPGKLEKVKTLEALIEEFLTLVPHLEKFSFPSISDVLSQAILNNPEFNANKAATAFKAIEKYATNLLVNPWRKEYRNIKMYCGFYKHTIERHLPSAHSVFIAMGYTQHGLELTLEEPLDPDLVARVALDCFVAFVECQIMIRIWEALTSYKCSWAEIHRVRQNYACGVEEATRLLHQIKRAEKQESSPAFPPLYPDSDLGSLWSQPPLAASNGHHHHPGQQQNHHDNHLLVDIANITSSGHHRKHPPPISSSSHYHDYLMKDDLLAPMTLSSNSNRGKFQLESLSVSRTRSPSWTEGLSSDHYHYGKPKSKMTHPVRWESEGADPYEVYTNGVSIGGGSTVPLPPPPPLAPKSKWTTDGVYQFPSLPTEDSWDMVDYSGGRDQFLLSCGGNSGSLPPRFPMVPALGSTMPPPLLPAPISSSSHNSSSQQQHYNNGIMGSSALTMAALPRYHQVQPVPPPIPPPPQMIDSSSHHHSNSLPRKMTPMDFAFDGGFGNRAAHHHVISAKQPPPPPPPYRYSVSTLPSFPLTEMIGNSSSMYPEPWSILRHEEQQTLKGGGTQPQQLRYNNHHAKNDLEAGFELEPIASSNSRGGGTNLVALTANNPQPIKPTSQNKESVKPLIPKRNSFYDNVPITTTDLVLAPIVNTTKENVKLECQGLAHENYKNAGKLLHTNTSGGGSNISTVGSGNNTTSSSSAGGLGGINNTVNNRAKNELNVILKVETEPNLARKIENGNTNKMTSATSTVAPSSPPVSNVTTMAATGWSCYSCTFLNGATKDICEMCGRSRNLAEDSNPLLSGGKQCPQCTLVNDKELNFCSACDTSLKDSPTYI